MRKKLFGTYLAIIIITILGSLCAFWGEGYQFIKEQNSEEYKIQAIVLADELSESTIDSPELLDKFVHSKSDKFGFRITVIELDGNVLADSYQSPQKLENHLSREEVQKALKDNVGVAVRYSKTTGVDYHYTAVRFKNQTYDGILRISLPLSNFQELQIGMMNSIVTLLFFGICLALLLAIIFTNKLSKPIIEITEAAERMARGDDQIKIYTREGGHIGRLTKAFNRMSKNLSISMDILTSKNTELEAILSSMTTGVVAIDKGSNIMFYNNGFKNIFELGEENVENEPLYQVIRNSTVFDIIDFVKEQNKGEIQEGVLLLSDANTEKSIKVTGVPLEREDSKIIGTLLVIEDVTNVKKLENIRKEFVSNVTHELKTPLTSIRGFVDTLKSGAINDPTYAVRFLDIIDIEAERLHSLIQDILVLSEIESRKEADNSMCRISSVLTDVTGMLEGKMKPKVQLICKVEEGLPDYMCNPFRLKEIFINIIDNAIKYTEKGSIQVECTHEGDFLLIRVKDTGIGIEASHLPRLFERFYRVDKGRSRKQGGTGLGLSIVKHIVELYNGTVRVDSKLGEGTVFTVRLPY